MLCKLRLLLSYEQEGIDGIWHTGWELGYHDDVVLGHVLRQLLDEAPVGGLLARDDHVWRQHLQRLDVGRQGGRGCVRTEHQHPLHPRLDAGQVEVLQRGQRLRQKAVDDVDGSFLERGRRRKKGGGGGRWIGKGGRK